MLVTEETERFRSLGNRVAWLFVPYVALGQAAQAAFPIPGLTAFTFEFFLLLATAILTSPWWVRRWRDLGPTALAVFGAFAVILLYAAISLLVHPPPHIYFHDVDVSRGFVAMPMGVALFAMLSGAGFILAAERHLRLRVLATAGAASLLVAFVGWPFQSAYRGYARLATGQGGAAIIHVMFLLIATFGLAQFLRGQWPRLGLAVTMLSLVGIAATQSRGAILNVAAWVGLVALGWLITRPRETKRLWPLGAGLLAAVALLPFIPGASRVLELFDQKRATNMQTALNIWNDDPSTMFFGAGPGQVWPWYAYESGQYAMPEGLYYEMAHTPHGELLLTPHSTPLALLVELGIPGALLGLVIGVALLVGWWRSRTSLPRLVVASAVLACLVAFVVDTYLIRNFGISLWWWAAIAVVSTWQQHADLD